MSLAFLFPGQGSQKVGMGKDLYEKSEIARNRYEIANQIMGMDIARLSFEGPENRLKETAFTQPSIFVLSVILFELLIHSGTNPTMVAGHSLGEYSALAAAGVFSFEEGLNLVKLRGECMQDAGRITSGTMAAIMGLDSFTIEQICHKVADEGIVKPANFNSPTQIVISGEKKGVWKAMELAKKAGALKVVELNVSGAFHSPLMKVAKNTIKEAIDKLPFQEPQFPIVMNVTARATKNIKTIKKNLIDQMDNPVRWVEMIQTFKKMGISEFFEVGPGNVLQGLNKRIDRSLSTKGISTYSDIFDQVYV